MCKDGLAHFNSDASEKKKTQTVVSHGTVIIGASDEEGQVFDDAEDSPLWQSSQLLRQERPRNNFTNRKSQHTHRKRSRITKRTMSNIEKNSLYGTGFAETESTYS